MKNKLVKIISFVVIIVCFILSGCKGGLYMEDFKDVQWTCSEIEMQFEYTSEDLEKAKGSLVKDGETIDIVCSYTLYKNIEVYDKDDYEKNSIEDIREPLLIGSYTIKGDIATVKIIQDNLFNGEYLDKEIQLTKTPLK